MKDRLISHSYDYEVCVSEGDVWLRQYDWGQQMECGLQLASSDVVLLAHTLIDEIGRVAAILDGIGFAENARAALDAQLISADFSRGYGIRIVADEKAGDFNIVQQSDNEAEPVSIRLAYEQGLIVALALLRASQVLNGPPQGGGAAPNKTT